MLIECIDTIARRLDRDILFAHIPDALLGGAFGNEGLNYEKCKTRDDAIAFLDEAGIAWRPCFRFFSTSGYILAPYTGTIFIDVPNDVTDTGYQAICKYFEHRNGLPAHSDEAGQ